MNNVLASIFPTHIYPSRIDRLKAVFVYTMLAIVTVVVVIVAISGVLVGGIASQLIPLSGLAIVGIGYALVRAKQLEIANMVIVIASMLMIITNNVLDGEVGVLTMLLNVLLLIMAGFLLETRGILLITASNIIQLFAFSAVEGVEGFDAAARTILAIIYAITGLVVFVYNKFVQANRLEGRDVEGSERLKLAEVNMRITRQASARESMDSALNSTLALILENYPQLYHAQVFLIDSDGIQARLVASTGMPGKQLLERNHSLAVGSLSVIGQTTFTGDPVIARTDDKNGVHRVNELLPETRLEAAFPLRVGTEIIGALDLQSKVLEELLENDRLTFQSLANSLSLAIDSIRQFEQAQARVEENQRLAEQTRTALREVERLNQRLIGRAWSEYVKGAGDNPGYSIDFATDHSNLFYDWTETLADAVRSNNLVQEGNVIAIPLRVRGQVVGAMEFELEENQDFTPEDLELITEVSERFGLAAENTRLVEESQRTAQRETLINQITSRFQSAQNVEATLAEAARSLSETLSADKVKIRLGTPESYENGKES